MFTWLLHILGLVAKRLHLIKKEKERKKEKFSNAKKRVWEREGGDESYCHNILTFSVISDGHPPQHDD